MENERNLILAYCAGLIDGDGSFFIGKENGPIRIAKGYSPSYSPNIGLSEVGRNSVDLLKNLFGGYVGKTKAYIAKDGSNRQEFFRWRLDRGNSCKECIEQLLPYLVLKKDRAQYLLNFINDHVIKENSDRLSDEELQIRENHYLKMKNFNSERLFSSDFKDRKVPSQNANNHFWSYVAGLYDSDGSFSLSRLLVKNRSTYSYYPSIVLSQIDCKSIDYVFGGFKKGIRSLNKNKCCKLKFAYRFEISCIEDITNFLTNCIPFLKLKKERAQLLLDFCNIRTHYRFTDEQHQDREQIFFKLKSHNMGSINPT